MDHPGRRMTEVEPSALYVAPLLSADSDAPLSDVDSSSEEDSATDDDTESYSSSEEDSDENNDWSITHRGKTASAHIVAASNAHAAASASAMIGPFRAAADTSAATSAMVAASVQEHCRGVRGALRVDRRNERRVRSERRRHGRRCPGHRPVHAEQSDSEEEREKSTRSDRRWTAAQGER